MSRIRINSDFGNGNTVDPKLAELAAQSVCLNSTGTDDAKLLLDMLGLIPAQPGFEIKGHVRQKLVNDAALKRQKRAERRKNVTGEQIGEPEDES